jgi:hypothetical protein
VNLFQQGLAVSNQNQHAFWRDPTLSASPIFLTADYVWGPGGLLVIESFASDRDAKGRRPADIDPADLLRAMLGLRILHFEDVEAAPDWGNTKTRLARLVAQKQQVGDTSLVWMGYSPSGR